MRERWKDIKGFSGYQVSNLGRVRTFRKSRKNPEGKTMIMSQSDDGNGYMKLMLYGDDGMRHCKKVHRLVAEAFIPNDDPTLDTVDHKISGREGKLDNSVKNLRWMSRRKNIQKAYHDGMCDARIRRQTVPVVATDVWTNEELYFHSVGAAAKFFGCGYTTISHALRENDITFGHYIFERAGREDILLYGLDEEYQLPWI